ncbi:MAG: hypothetical protein Q8Q85_09255 [Gemmatimonadales bacterium]|nr:hypothetical protein [Gemmatimonadales bacterium]
MLPFANLSRDSADVYLAEGLTEELISRLGAVARLRVPGRSVVVRAQAAVADPQALARRLGVRYLVEGSVRRGGNRLRVSVRLLRAADGVRVWGEDYNRGQEDLLDVQETIAREVATNVAGQLLPGERSVLVARPTRDPAAWDHFLRGNHALGTRSAGSLAAAIREYHRALALDSTFTAAQARIAYAYVLAGLYGLEGIPADSAAVRAERAAQRALLLDQNSSDAWLAWGWLRAGTNTASGMREARSALERAVRLDPRNAEAHHQLGQVLTFLGQDSAAVATYERALAIDPLRAQTLYELSLVLSFSHRWVVTLRLADSAVAENPLLWRARVGRARARLATGDARGALEDARRAHELGSGIAVYDALTVLVAAAAALGDTASARGYQAAFEAAPSADFARGMLATGPAIGRIALGDREGAIAMLQTIPPSVIYSWILRYPEFDPIRADPRFQRIEAAARAAP